MIITFLGPIFCSFLTGPTICAYLAWSTFVLSGRRFENSDWHSFERSFEVEDCQSLSLRSWVCWGNPPGYSDVNCNDSASWWGLPLPRANPERAGKSKSSLQPCRGGFNIAECGVHSCASGWLPEGSMEVPLCNSHVSIHTCGAYKWNYGWEGLVAIGGSTQMARAWMQQAWKKRWIGCFRFPKLFNTPTPAFPDTFLRNQASLAWAGAPAVFAEQTVDDIVNGVPWIRSRCQCGCDLIFPSSLKE